MDSILKFNIGKLLKVVYQYQFVAKLTNNNGHSTDGYKWTNSPQRVKTAENAVGIFAAT
jgi:hypothetical protein